MTQTRRLGVAVIGLGVGEQHARTYAALPACQVRAVCDPDAKRSEQIASELGTAIARSDMDVFDDPEIDIVSIASPDDAHCRQVLAALRAGKHVFVEKPFCRSRAELQDIRDVWSRRGDRHISSNLVLRAAPLYVWLREAIRGGDLGEIYAIDGDYLYGRLNKITDEWRSRVADYSVMLGGGVHMVDLMLWLTGQRPTRATATGNKISTRGTAFRYPDFVSATYDFESGLVGRITANFGCVHRHQHVLRVFGTRATFIHDDSGARLHQSRDPSSSAAAIALAPKPASKGALIPAFVDSILANCPAGPALQVELDVIAACIAADRALASETPTEIAYV